MSHLPKAASGRAKWSDRIARWVITLGGVTIIAAVVGILLLIVGVTIPLFLPARATLSETLAPQAETSPGEVLGLGIDASQDSADPPSAMVWHRNGTLSVVNTRTGEVLRELRAVPPGPGASLRGVQSVRPVESAAACCFSLLWSDGATSLVEVKSLAQQLAQGSEAEDLKPGKITREAFSKLAAPGAVPKPAAKAAPGAYALSTLAKMAWDEQPAPRQAFLRHYTKGDDRYDTRLAVFPDGRVRLTRAITVSRMDEDQTATVEVPLTAEIAGQITVWILDSEGKAVYGGTADGHLARWRLDDDGQVAQREVFRAFADGRAITALATVFGDVSLAVGDAQGGLTAWFPVEEAKEGNKLIRKMRLIHTLHRHPSAVRQILPSGRSKGLLSLSAGGLHLDYTTSERHLDVAGGDCGDLRFLAFGARGDLAAGLDGEGRLSVWRIRQDHPEVSWKTLLGKVHYEGYDRAEFAWQSTGGQDTEPKYSLVPLLFGTLKGTFYAMLLAVPLALLGAAYLSQFSTPALKGAIKPVVEVMAAIPSVVIGFLAALWLAPLVDKGLLTVILSVLTVPAAFLAFMVLWQYLRRHERVRRLEHGYEFVLLAPALALGLAAAAWAAGPIERWLFGGSLAQWFASGPLQTPYVRLNSVIVAFGLGFTVIPIIFSIAEDAMSAVPYSMTGASLALGASRWQTLWRVVLPSASPGIFAATMIGFGRAVGETMIMVMATGNTPVMSPSFLNGMRTLSANIAVEIPEAPVDGTLYRVLFLCAVLLFLLTFTANTAAEVVRQQLRKRYGRF